MNQLLLAPTTSSPATHGAPSDRGDAIAPTDAGSAFDQILNTTLERRTTDDRPRSERAANDRRVDDRHTDNRTNERADRGDDRGDVDRSDANRSDVNRGDADGVDDAAEADDTEAATDETTDGDADGVTEEPVEGDESAETDEAASGETATTVVTETMVLAETALPTIATAEGDVALEQISADDTAVESLDVIAEDADPAVDSNDQQPLAETTDAAGDAATATTTTATATATTLVRGVDVAAGDQDATAETADIDADRVTRAATATAATADGETMTDDGGDASDQPSGGDATEVRSVETIDTADAMTTTTASTDNASDADAAPTTSTTTTRIDAAATTADIARPASALAEPASASTTAEAAATLSGDAGGETNETALVRQVQRALSNIRLNARGEQTFTIRLHPEELGSVTVKVTTSDTAVRVGLVTDTAAAASALANQRTQLVQELTEGGLDGASVDVAHGDASSAGSGDADADADESDGGSGGDTGIGGLARNERQAFRAPRTATDSTIDLDL